MNMTRTILRSLRIPFLILTPSNIFLGLATALVTSEQISYLDFLLVLGGALFAHVSVNTFNEYHDFRSGLDAKTTKTPFSGGSGALIDNPKAAEAVFSVAIISLFLTVIIGFYFTFTLGILIFPLGVVGVLIIITYTKWLNRYPFLCLVAPGIGFGPLMVVGTHVVLSGEYSMQVMWISLVPLYLTSNLLLLNQYPDIVADRTVGRRHFPIVYGVNKSTRLYGIFVLAASGVIVTGIYTGLLPTLSVIGLIPMGISSVVFVGAIKYANSLQKFIPFLGMNVIATVLAPVLLGLSIILG